MEKLWEFLKIINYMEFASLNTQMDPYLKEILIMEKKTDKVFLRILNNILGIYSTNQFVYNGEWKEDLKDGNGKIEIKINDGLYVYDSIWIADKP